MNIRELMKDELVRIPEEKQPKVKICFKKWLPCKWISENSIFMGMHNNGLPAGYIRCISETGEVYEGMANESFALGTYGWGRELVGDYTRIGWWKNWCWKGNCRRFLNQRMDQAAWFEESFISKTPMKEGHKDYPHWDYKDKYWNKPDYEKKWSFKMDLGSYTPVEKIKEKMDIFDIHFNEEGMKRKNYRKYY